MLTIVAGLWIARQWGAYTARQDAALKATREEIAALGKRTDSILSAVANVRRAVRNHVTIADTHRVVMESILVKHPIDSAPVACRPWTLALSECQKQTVALRAALALDTIALAKAEITIFQQKEQLAKANKALNDSDGRWFLGVPCPMVVVGGGVSSRDPLDPLLQVTLGFPVLGKGRC